MRKTVRSVVWLAAFAGLGGPARPAGDAALEVAVVGQVAGSYKREKLPDGTPKPERYAFANGGAIKGTMRDASVEKVPFPMIAYVVGRHLAKQKYILADQASEADLLIVLHWGNTMGFDDNNYSQSVDRNASAMTNLNQTGTKLEAMKHGVLSGTTEEMEVLEKEKQRASDDLESAVTVMNLENRSRDMGNLDNARVLGYLDAINARRDTLFSEISGSASDLMRDVEEKRYYVVLSAYDFRAMKEKKKQALRWVTRISIRAAGNSFDERMAQMIASAAATLGKKSDLNRRFYGDPRVELREVEYLGVAAPATPTVPADAAGEKPAK